MCIAKYLLDIEEFLDTENGEALLERASLCVDEDRRGKAERMGMLSGKAACLGAGLLLQFAVEEALKGDGGSCPDGLAGESAMCGFGLAGMDAVSGAGLVGMDVVSGAGLAGMDVVSGAGLAGVKVVSGSGLAGADAVFGSDLARTSVVTSAGLRESGTTVDIGMAESDVKADVTLTGKAAAACGSLQVYSVSQLLANREGAQSRQFVYRYGKYGKPYFADLPFYFNLSHSGSYVLCGLSMEEIGADIQQHCGRNVERLARRFYSEREAAALEQAGETWEQLFYRLWARKEAYGKLTGKGVAGILGVDLLPATDGGMLLHNQGRVSRGCSGIRKIISEATSLSEGRFVIWEECCCVEGYSIAFCRCG